MAIRIRDERLRKLDSDCFLKIRTLDSRVDREKIESDGRLDRARDERKEALNLIEQGENEQAEEQYKKCRRTLNSMLTKFFDTASLNKICDWK